MYSTHKTQFPHVHTGNQQAQSELRGTFPEFRGMLLKLRGALHAKGTALRKLRGALHAKKTVLHGVRGALHAKGTVLHARQKVADEIETVYTRGRTVNGDGGVVIFECNYE